MNTQTQKPILDAQAGLRNVAKRLEEALTLAHSELSSLHQTLSTSPDLDLMREQEIPWDLASYLHDQITDLAEEGGFAEIEDPVVYLRELAELTEEDLQEEFVAGKRAVYRCHTNPKGATDATERRVG